MTSLSNIKIRNAYSHKNNLVFTYKEGKKRKTLEIKEYLWYCVIKTTDWMEHQDKLLRSNCVLSYEVGAEYTKLFADKNEGAPNSRSKSLLSNLQSFEVEVFEADLHSAKRFMVDNEVEVSEEYDILYFDIETDDTTRKIEIGKTRILSFGAIDNHGKEFYFDDEDEKDLLKKAWKLMHKYDVVAGWNINEFDIPYIEDRIYKLFNRGIQRKWYKIARIDMLARARKLFKEDAALRSYSLENVSQHFLKKGKIKFEGKVVDLPPDKLKEYNMHDVYLLKELDEKTGMIDLIAKECAFSKCLIRDFAGVYVSQVLDNMILREAHKMNIYCPSKKKVDEEVDYVGGLVFDPQVGYHKNVYVFDFTSLYPSIIMTSNIGFDTIANTEEKIDSEFEHLLTNPGTKVFFNSKQESVISKVIRRLLEERKAYKKLRLDLVGAHKMETEEYTQARANEIIVKELSNSVYGIMGNQHLRYYQLEIAESITKTGHYLLEFTRDFFNSLEGMNVIYGDTDSVFVAGEKVMDVENVLKQYHEELENNLKRFNIQKSYIQLKYEKLFSGMILVGKKYYAGRVTNIEGKEVNEFVVKGLDMVKKATLPIAYLAQKTLVEMILEDSTQEELMEYVEEQKKKIMENEFSFDELKVRTGINKDIKDYKQLNAPHVKLARSIIEDKGVLETNEIEYVIVDDTAAKDSVEGLALREQYTGKFDRNFYWNNRVWPPMKRILESVFPTVEWDNLYEIKKERKSRIKIEPGQQPLF